MAQVDVKNLEYELDSLRDQLERRLKQLEAWRSTPSEDPDLRSKIEHEEKGIADLNDQIKRVEKALASARQTRPEEQDSPVPSGQFVIPQDSMVGKTDQGIVDIPIPTKDEGKPLEAKAAAWPSAADPELWAQFTGENGPAGRWDPVILGVGAGSGPESAVTITALVTDNAGQPYLLAPGAELEQNPTLLQPALSDGGNPDSDPIGELSRMAFNERCDAALVSINSEREIQSRLPDGSFVTGTAEPQLGLQVRKFGRATGLTFGFVTLVDVTISIGYQDQNRTFEKLIMVSADKTASNSAENVSIQQDAPDMFSSGGDRGALLLDEQNRAIAMIIAHSSNVTVAVPISTVLEQLEVTLVDEPASAIRRERAADGLAIANDQVKNIPDKLNISEYVDAFVRLIYDPATRPPLAIGIYGAWGVGKSFLMNKIEEELRTRMEADVQKLVWYQKPLRVSPNRLPIITFNAWAYNAGDKLWAGLMQEIFRGVEKTGLGWQVKLRLNLKRNLERQWKAFKAKLLPYTLMATVIAILALAFVLNNRQELAAALLTPVGLAALFSGLKELIGLFSTPASDRVVELFEGPDYSKELGFMDRIRNDLENLASSLPAGMKVIVFIDDLDRCEPEKAVKVLEAVKLILDIERFIVFLGLDTRVVTEAVEQHYGKVLTEAGISGYEYLNKIVQIPFSIPSPNPNEISNYLGHLMGIEDETVQAIREKATRPATVLQTQAVVAPTGADQPPAIEHSTRSPTADKELRPLFFEDIQPFTEAEQTAFIALAEHLVTNPRRLKRLVNIYRLVRALATKRGVSLIHDRPQDVLLWLVLCEQWPYLTHLMLEEIDQRLDDAKTTQELESVLSSSLPSLHTAAQKLIESNGNPKLIELDQDYQQLESLVQTFGNSLSVAEIRLLRPFTINFNPALTAEVQRSLASS